MKIKTRIIKNILSTVLSISLLLQVGLSVIYAEGEKTIDNTETEVRETTIKVFVDLSDEVDHQRLTIGADESDVVLPETLEIILEPEKITLNNITWTIDADNSDFDFFGLPEALAGTNYTYIPVLPNIDDQGNELLLGENVTLPQIHVSVEESTMRTFSNPRSGYTYNISQGPIIISAGTNSKTIKISYGNEQTADNIDANQPLTIIGSVGRAQTH